MFSFKTIIIKQKKSLSFFTDVDQVVDSSLLQNTDGSFICGVCGKKSATRQHMRSHVETHLNLSFTCDVCNKQYRTRNSLMVHKSTMHKNCKDNRMIYYNKI